MRPDKRPESESRDIGVNWCIFADKSHGVVFLFLLELYKKCGKEGRKKSNSDYPYTSTRRSVGNQRRGEIYTHHLPQSAAFLRQDQHLENFYAHLFRGDTKISRDIVVVILDHMWGTFSSFISSKQESTSGIA